MQNTARMKQPVRGHAPALAIKSQGDRKGAPLPYTDASSICSARIG